MFLIFTNKKSSSLSIKNLLFSFYHFFRFKYSFINYYFYIFIINIINSIRFSILILLLFHRFSYLVTPPYYFHKIVSEFLCSIIYIVTMFNCISTLSIIYLYFFWMFQHCKSPHNYYCIDYQSIHL